MKRHRLAVFSLAEQIDHPLASRILPVLGPPLERLLGLRRLAELYSAWPDGLSVRHFLQRTLDGLDVRISVEPRDLARIPVTGPVVVVANHPFGGIEGIALARVLLSIRPDVRVMANYMLGRIPELAELFCLVDPFATPASRRRNLAAMRAGVRSVENGGMLAVFPSGEVAHLDPSMRRVTDPPWSSTVARIVRRTGATVLPVYFPGRNSSLFQALGLVHPLLRTAMLPREMLRRQGRRLEVRIGSPISFRRLAGIGTDDGLMAYLRRRCEVLAERRVGPGPTVSPPVQPRRTPARSVAVAPQRPVHRMRYEIASLPAEQLLVDAGELCVHAAEAWQVPEVLHEIARLRELTFRSAGEGTGRALDLDTFDDAYTHLFVWNRRRHEVVGAYRLGHTDRLIAERGIQGLYTSTLFRYQPQLFEAMGPALEMGRSFIRPEYQKSFAGLLLLWKGIGQYVLANPTYATLFGPVSISADYLSASQRLIVAFLKQNSYAHPWSRRVRPRTPFRPRHQQRTRRTAAHLRDLEDASAFIADIEADGKGVPILLKQYLKLGGRLLGFNVDPDFCNVLDVLIMVDLRRTEPRILSRYMGRDQAAAFLAAHGVVTAA